MSELFSKLDAGPVPDDVTPVPTNPVESIDWGVYTEKKLPAYWGGIPDTNAGEVAAQGVNIMQAINALTKENAELKSLALEWDGLKPASLEEVSAFAIRLSIENAELKRLNLALADRCEKQSELLSRKAEK